MQAHHVPSKSFSLVGGGENFQELFGEAPANSFGVGTSSEADKFSSLAEVVAGLECLISEIF